MARVLWVVFLSLGLLLSGFPSVPTADASTCTADQLVPTLGRFEVNQGLGSYGTLARGKEIFVRVQLTNPPTSTCTLGSNQGIFVTRGDLTVTVTTGGGAATYTSGSISAYNAADVAVSPALSAAPALVDSKHDPIFVVGATLPLSLFPAPAPTTRFSATFKATITFNRKLSANNTVAGLTTSPPLTVTKTVEQQSKAIRILFQPMGDMTKASTTPQFTDANRTAVVSAVQTALRILPVPAGPAGALCPRSATCPTGRDPAVPTPGIRYAINGGLLDLSAVQGAIVGGTFCATSSAWDGGIKAQLGTFLQSWNAANAAEDAADYVVGVYGEEISDSGCALGMASVNSKESMVMAISDRKSGGTLNVSKTGGVLVQEITHNIGGQPAPRSTSFHSSFVQADNTDPDGAYNLTSRTYISSDKTAMNVNSSTTPWDNNVTVLEKLDWEYDLCQWGGFKDTITPAECATATPAPGGTLTGVPAIDSFVASGDTRGVKNAYFATSSSLTTPDSSSHFRALQLKGDCTTLNILDNTGIPVSFLTTHGDALVSPVGVFSFSNAGMLSQAVRLEIRKLADSADPLSNPCAGNLVFSSTKQTDAPRILSTTTSSGDLLAPGESASFQKAVTTPVIAPKPDVYFFADTTGSMGSALATVKCNAVAILNTIKAQTTSPRFGAGDYKDFQSEQHDPYAFNNAAPLPPTDDNGQQALNAIGQNVDTPCLPTTSIASTRTGAPVETFVTPYVATKSGRIDRWRAQFVGGLLDNGQAGVPAGIQIKVLRQADGNPRLLRVMSVGAVHDPRPALRARFPGYPSFRTQDAAIEFTESAALDLLPGDLVGVTIQSDAAAGAYFYPMVSRTGTRVVTRDVPSDGTIDLDDPFTGSPPDAPALQVGTNNGWNESGGYDTPEGQLFGLQQIASPTGPSATTFDVKWRGDSTRVLVWIGDNPGHDPVCAAISGLSSGITETTATNALTSAGIKVVAASVNTGGLGLDGDPKSFGFFGNDYASKCGAPGGTSGQGTRITNATGGVLQQNVKENDLASAILDNLHNLPATVKPQRVDGMCNNDLTLRFNPTEQTVTSGNPTKPFEEIATVATGAANGPKTCTIEFLVNGKRVTLADGSFDPAFRQVIKLDVGQAEVTVQATSGNPAAVADILYQCSAPVYPIAVAVPPVAQPDGTLKYVAPIDQTLVPGGNCKVTAVVSDLFRQSDRNDPNATTTLNVTKKGPRDLAIYAPAEGALFTPRQTIAASGWGTDSQGRALIFTWSIAGPSSGNLVVGPPPGSTAEFRPATEWAIGPYTVRLRGTDPDGNFIEQTHAINVVLESALPQVYSFDGFFSPVKNWPATNEVNGGQATAFKWRLADRFGNPVKTTDSIFGALLEQVNCTTREELAAPVIDWQVGKTMIRFDDKAGQFVWNATIPAGLNKCYTWTLQLVDGSQHPLFIKVVK